MPRTFRLPTLAAMLAVTAGGIAGGLYWSRSMANEKLDDSLIALFRASRGKPWQWKAKEVIYDYMQVQRALLVRRDYMGKNEEIRTRLRTLEREISNSRNWAEPIREYVIPKLPEQQRLNGYPSPAYWEEKALVWQGEYPLGRTALQENSARWRLCYDTEYLYFKAAFPDRSRFLSPSEQLYDQDAFELFILPEIRFYTYVELVISADNRHYTRWVNQTERSRYELSHFTPATLETKTAEHDGFWEIEGRIGFVELPGYLHGNPAKSGESIRLMMLRIDAAPAGEKQVFSPVPFLYDGHNFFGYMKFTLQ